MINIGTGIWFVLLCGLFVLLLFKNEVNLLALLFIRLKRFAWAEKVLSWVKDPSFMVKRQEAYYYFLNGNIAAQHRNIKESEKWFRKALNTGLRMKMDQAMAKLSLAAGSVSRRRKREAEMLLRDVKKLDKYKMLDSQVKMLREQMKRI